MKNKLTFLAIIIIGGLGWANQTRMNTLLAGDFIDDPVNIAVFPQHIALFQNTLYGDITGSLDDFGIIVAVKPQLGGLAVWEKDNLNVGYGTTVRRFDIGLHASPVKDDTRFGVGLGRAFFASRCDLSFLMSTADQNKNFAINLRCLKRKMDFIIVDRYAYSNYKEPLEFQTHYFGLMLQRLVLSEGFAFLAADYLYNTSSSPDIVKVYSGFELPLSSLVYLRLGCRDAFTIDEGLNAGNLEVEPGIALHIRDFSLDFHLNRDRFFDKNLTLVKSFGADLNFGKF